MRLSRLFIVSVGVIVTAAVTLSSFVGPPENGLFGGLPCAYAQAANPKVVGKIKLVYDKSTNPPTRKLVIDRPWPETDVVFDCTAGTDNADVWDQVNGNAGCTATVEYTAGPPATIVSVQIQ